MGGQPVQQPRESVIRTSQIITWAMAAGVMTLGVVALGVVRRPTLDAQSMGLDGGSPITLMGLLFGVMAMVLSRLVPLSMTRRAASGLLAQEPATGEREPASAPWYALFQTQHIVGLALVEGAAFLNLVAYLVEGKVLSVILALILLGRIIASVPSAGSVDAWVNDQRQASLDSDGSRTG